MEDYSPEKRNIMYMPVCMCVMYVLSYLSSYILFNDFILP